MAAILSKTKKGNDEFVMIRKDDLKEIHELVMTLQNRLGIGRQSP